MLQVQKIKNSLLPISNDLWNHRISANDQKPKLLKLLTSMARSAVLMSLLQQSVLIKSSKSSIISDSPNGLTNDWFLTNQILACYVTKTLTNVATLNSGKILRLLVPWETGSATFNLYVQSIFNTNPQRRRWKRVLASDCIKLHSNSRIYESKTLTLTLAKSLMYLPTIPEI